MISAAVHDCVLIILNGWCELGANLVANVLAGAMRIRFVSILSISKRSRRKRRRNWTLEKKKNYQERQNN